MGRKNLFVFKGKGSSYNGMISEAAAQYMGSDEDTYNFVNVFETHGLVIIPSERTIKKGTQLFLVHCYWTTKG